MEELIVIQGHGSHIRPGALRDVRNRAMTANQIAAWRAPGATRFDSRPANDVRADDFLARADAVAPRTFAAVPTEPQPMPRWVIFAIGAVVAALLGGVVGGMMSV